MESGVEVDDEENMLVVPDGGCSDENEAGGARSFFKEGQVSLSVY